MQVIVMPNSVTKDTRVPLFVVETTLARLVCDQVFTHIYALIDKRRDALVNDLVSIRRSKGKWWQRLIGGSTDYAKVREELASVSSCENDAWLQCSFEYQGTLLACTRVIKACENQGNEVQIPQSDWATVLRAHNKIAN